MRLNILPFEPQWFPSPDLLHSKSTEKTEAALVSLTFFSWLYYLFKTADKWTKLSISWIISPITGSGLQVQKSCGNIPNNKIKTTKQPVKALQCCTNHLWQGKMVLTITEATVFWHWQEFRTNVHFQLVVRH